MIDWPRLFRALRGQPEPEPDKPLPLTGVPATGDQVFQALMKVVPQSAHVYISDNVYMLCSKADIDRFLAFDSTNKEVYVSESHDCDDFSYRLMGQLSDSVWSGIAFGIIWTDAHAFNIMVDDQMQVWYIEPQSDAVKMSIEDWQGSEILFICM